MPGSSKARCGSPASIGLPVAVRLGASAQLLLPPPVPALARQQAQRADRLAKTGQASDPPAGIGAGRNAQPVGPAIVVAQLDEVISASLVPWPSPHNTPPAATSNSDPNQRIRECTEKTGRHRLRQATATGRAESERERLQRPARPPGQQQIATLAEPGSHSPCRLDVAHRMHEQAPAIPAQVCRWPGPASHTGQPTAQIGYSRAGHGSAPITQCDPLSRTGTPTDLIKGRGLLCRPRGWVHAGHPILQVQPGSGVTTMKASPGTRVQRPGDDDGVIPPSAPRQKTRLRIQLR